MRQEIYRQHLKNTSTSANETSAQGTTEVPTSLPEETSGGGLADHLRIPIGAKLAAQATQTSLTFRELDVIKLIARGCLNKEIADRLDITEGTVKAHTSALFSKLGVSNRTEAVREAVRRGLVRLE